jgi:hypothetical protein
VRMQRACVCRWFVDDDAYMKCILFEGAVEQQTNNPCESIFNWFKNHKALKNKNLSIVVQGVIVSVVAIGARAVDRTPQEIVKSDHAKIERNTSGVLSSYARCGAIHADGEPAVDDVPAPSAAAAADDAPLLTATAAASLPDDDDDDVSTKVKRARVDNSPTTKSQMRVPRGADEERAHVKQLVPKRPSAARSLSSFKIDFAPGARGQSELCDGANSTLALAWLIVSRLLDHSVLTLSPLAPGNVIAALTSYTSVLRSGLGRLQPRSSATDVARVALEQSHVREFFRAQALPSRRVVDESASVTQLGPLTAPATLCALVRLATFRTDNGRCDNSVDLPSLAIGSECAQCDAYLTACKCTEFAPGVIADPPLAPLGSTDTHMSGKCRVCRALVCVTCFRFRSVVRVGIQRRQLALSRKGTASVAAR